MYLGDYTGWQTVFTFLQTEGVPQSKRSTLVELRRHQSESSSPKPFKHMVTSETLVTPGERLSSMVLVFVNAS